jgi:hypothetical protein
MVGCGSAGYVILYISKLYLGSTVVLVHIMISKSYYSTSDQREDRSVSVKNPPLKD